jgi:uncharacterized protein (UPF0179 family)
MGGNTSENIIITGSTSYFGGARYHRIRCEIDEVERTLKVPKDGRLMGYLMEMVVGKRYKVVNLRISKESFARVSRVENISPEVGVRRSVCEILDKKSLSEGRTSVSVAWQFRGCDTYLTRGDDVTVKAVQRLEKSHFYEIEYFMDGLSYMTIIRAQEVDSGLQHYEGYWDEMAIL